MQKKNVVVIGCNDGKGKTFCELIAGNREFSVVAGVDKENVGIHPFPVFSSVENLSEHQYVEDIQVDVIIDFSDGNFTLPSLIFAVSTLTPLVITTSNLDISTEHLLQYWARIIPIAKSDDFACGIKALEASIYLLLLKAEPDKMQPHIYTTI